MILLLLKIPNISNLVQKTYYNAIIGETENKNTAYHDHDKYITPQEFNKLTWENFTARQNDFANLVKNTHFDNKVKYVTSNKIELNDM